MRANPQNIRNHLILAALLTGFWIPASIAAEQDSLREKSPSRPVYETFTTTRIISAHSTETVKGRFLDFRVTHKFGDIGGDVGGSGTLFGLDNVVDVRIAFEYGVTDNLTIGFGRSKGAQRRQLFEGHLKYRFLTQTTDNSMPFSVALYSNAMASGMTASADSTSETSFQKFEHRLTYVTQVLIARKFGDRFSLQLMPTYLHRNYVAFSDQNGLFAAGIGGRIRLTKVFGLIGEYFYVMRQNNIINGVEYLNPLSFGLEIKTGGHVFHLNFSNSKGITTNEFIPYTTSSWLKGEFRFGFNISRPFKIL